MNLNNSRTKSRLFRGRLLILLAGTGTLILMLNYIRISTYYFSRLKHTVPHGNTTEWSSDIREMIVEDGTSLEIKNDNSPLPEEYPFDPTLTQQHYNGMLRTNTKIFKNDFFLFYCEMADRKIRVKRNRNLVVIENLIRGEEAFGCHESITYATHGDYRYLINLIPLVERWEGPVSVALYSPGDDLKRTLEIISFLRDCTLSSDKMKKLVSFHLFFDSAYFSGQTNHQDSIIQQLNDLYEQERWKNCNESLNVSEIETEMSFKQKKKLLYPVNIARNIARSVAPTHFVLVSDIELYPSENIVHLFFEMLQNERRKLPINSPFATIPPRQVWVTPVFELKYNIKVPWTKRRLKVLLGLGEAIPFHTGICKECHAIPEYERWLEIPETNPESLNVFYTAKRQHPFEYWEPIFIGTKYDPPYDERLSWEGRRDKMTQGYQMCILDFNFLVLDNAFLVHKPGLKKITPKFTKIIVRQDKLINSKIQTELHQKFGKNVGCRI